MGQVWGRLGEAVSRQGGFKASITKRCVVEIYFSEGKWWICFTIHMRSKDKNPCYVMSKERKKMKEGKFQLGSCVDV